MWIRTQTNAKILNTDNIVGIFIDAVPCQIKAYIANSSEGDSVMLLASYNSMEDCKEVFDAIMLTITNPKFNYICLPLGSDVKGWINDLEKLLLKM